MKLGLDIEVQSAAGQTRHRLPVAGGGAGDAIVARLHAIRLVPAAPVPLLKM